MPERSYFCPPGFRDLLRDTTAGMSDIYQYFEELLGLRLPYEQFKVLFVRIYLQCFRFSLNVYFLDFVWISHFLPHAPLYDIYCCFIRNEI